MTYKHKRGKKHAAHPRYHELLQELDALHNAKNFDYAAGAKQGPLGNFQRVAQYLGMYPNLPQGKPSSVALVYMLKQLDAAIIMMSTGKHSRTGEGVHERLRDVAAYAILLMLLTKEENK
jgi:hypothetical protein